MKPSTVALTIIALALAIVAWDVWLYMDDIERNSISQVIIDATARSPLVSWFIGLLMGGLAVHLFEAAPLRRQQQDVQRFILEALKGQQLTAPRKAGKIHILETVHRTPREIKE